jgi:hypothetical protein
MTVVISGALLMLALLDGAFAGFRSSVGRSGLLNHRGSDKRAAWYGLALVSGLLAPVIVAVSIDDLTSRGAHDAYRHAGTAMLIIYGPFALVILVALVCYACLGWRQKYLASALILGPFTALRPIVAIGGAVFAAVSTDNARVACAVLLAVVAVLAVEPLANRRERATL